MDTLLKIEVAVLMLLVVATVFVRLGITDGSAETLGTDPIIQVQPSSPTESEPLQPETAPTQTEPEEIRLTFGEDYLQSRDYFVYSCSDDQIICISGEEDKLIYPASITKLFTAYVALQYLDPDDVVTLGREVYMVEADSSLAYVKNGQTISVATLVEGVLLPSGNDAAYGLAVAAAKAESGNSSMDPSDALEYFVGLMNKTAQAEGMTGSHFANPDGYHDFDHYTTCRDLMTIGRLALENDLIRSCVSKVTDKVPFSNGDVATWNNTNHLIDPESQYYCEDAIGLKTGHTGYAGFCLLSAFEIDGEYYIFGSFGCERPEDRFIDTLKLYDLLIDALN